MILLTDYCTTREIAAFGSVSLALWELEVLGHTDRQTNMFGHADMFTQTNRPMFGRTNIIGVTVRRTYKHKGKKS